MFLRGQHMPKDTQMFLKDEKAYETETYETSYERDHFFSSHKQLFLNIWLTV